MKTIIRTSIGFLLLIASLSSCKKDNEPGSNAPARDTRYEIKGNYTGHLLVVTNDNEGNTQDFSITALPWNRENTYPAAIRTFAYSGITLANKVGAPGQTITVSLYVGGKLVKTLNATTDQNGIVSIPSLVHTF